MSRKNLGFCSVLGTVHLRPLVAEADYSEFIAGCLDAHTDLIESALSHVFHVFDINGDGKISLKELSSILTTDGSLSIVLPEGKTIEEFMKEFRFGFKGQWINDKTSQVAVEVAVITVVHDDLLCRRLISPKMDSSALKSLKSSWKRKQHGCHGLTRSWLSCV